MQNTFIVGAHEAQVLLEATSMSLVGSFPRLRLLPILNQATFEAVWKSLPRHIRTRLIVNPSDRQLSSISAILTSSSSLTRSILPNFPVSRMGDWETIAAFYGEWVKSTYLPGQARKPFHPDGLFPVDYQAPPTTLEITGSCAAESFAQAISNSPEALFANITPSLRLRNHPGELPPQSLPLGSVRLIFPPLRSMHPRTLNQLVDLDLSQDTIETVTRHLESYLDDAHKEHPETYTFVANFLVPPVSWQGRILDDPTSLLHIQQFISRLNNVVRKWSAAHPGCYVIDVDNLANIIGKRHLDDSTINIFSHRAPLASYDDWIDASSLSFPSVLQSYAIYSDEFHRLILEELHFQLVTLRHQDLVKLVVFDLDDTLWRGNASDLKIGSWEGRPISIVEAIKVLKSRGVLVAISSSNDNSFISEHWEELTSTLADVPLNLPLRLEDFDDVQISFEPKPSHMARILRKFNLLPDSVVFVDDNPLQREAMLTQYPTMRVLGSEPNYIRRELLFSPFLQQPYLTTERNYRAASVKIRENLNQISDNSARESFLTQLGLYLQVSDVENVSNPDGERALELLNKTNQWNLNGRRLDMFSLSGQIETRRLVVGRAWGKAVDFGIVIVAVLDLSTSTVTSMAVSCRVIGFGLEDAFLAQFNTGDGRRLWFDFQLTEKNRAAQAYLSNLPHTEEGAGRWLVELPQAPDHVQIVSTGRIFSSNDHD